MSKRLAEQLKLVSLPVTHGWFELVYELTSDLVNIDPKFILYQVSEKNDGTLNYSYSCSDRARFTVASRVSRCLLQCEQTCPKCGSMLIRNKQSCDRCMVRGVR